MKKIAVLTMLFILVMAVQALATGWPVGQGTGPTDFNVTYRVKNMDTAALGKGAPVVLSTTEISTNSNFGVLGTTSTTSVELVGVLEDTIEAGAIGNMIIYGVADVLFDSSGATTGASFGAGTTKGHATSGETGLGSVIDTRSGTGLTKCFIKVTE